MRQFTIYRSRIYGVFVRFHAVPTLIPFTRGKCEVSIEYRANGAEASLTLGEAWSVRVTRELRDQLARALGDDSYLIHYPRHFL